MQMETVWHTSWEHMRDWRLQTNLSALLCQHNWRNSIKSRKRSALHLDHVNAANQLEQQVLQVHHLLYLTSEETSIRLKDLFTPVIFL